MYLVCGVSGHTGRVVASELLQEGKQVRVLVRTEEKGEPWRAKGAEVAVTSLDDVNGLIRALDGVKGFYFLVPPNPRSNNLVSDYRWYTSAVREAMTQCPIERLVCLSAWGAHRADGPFPMHREMENTLTSLSTHCTVLRASFFMENVVAFIPSMRDSGVLPCFFQPKTKLPMVSTQDIGETAAKLLTNPQPPSIVELTGPTDCSMEEVADAFALAFERPIRTHQIPRVSISETLVNSGASAKMGEFYTDMVKAFEEGRITAEGGIDQIWHGRVTIQDFADKALKTTPAGKASLR